MELSRVTVELGVGGFRGAVFGDAAPSPGVRGKGVFFVGVENPPGRSYDLGVDLNGPIRGVGAVSVDGGASFAGQADFPVLNGNFMIRAVGRHAPWAKSDLSHRHGASSRRRR